MGLSMEQKKGPIINTFPGATKEMLTGQRGLRPAPGGRQGRAGRPGFCVEFKAPSES